MGRAIKFNVSLQASCKLLATIKFLVFRVVLGTHLLCYEIPIGYIATVSHYIVGGRLELELLWHSSLCSESRGLTWLLTAAPNQVLAADGVPRASETLPSIDVIANLRRDFEPAHEEQVATYAPTTPKVCRSYSHKSLLLSAP